MYDVVKKSQNAPVIVSVACLAAALLWALATQVHFTFVHSPRFLDDEFIGDFATKYRWTSLAETGVAFVPGMAVSAVALLRRTRWSAVLLMVFALFCLWFFFVRGFGLFFQPGFGDGSFVSALSAWWELNFSRSGMRILFLAALVLSVVFAAIQVVRQRECPAGSSGRV